MLETIGTIAGSQDDISGCAYGLDEVFLRGPSSLGIGHVWFQACECECKYEVEVGTELEVEVELELELLKMCRGDSMLLGNVLKPFEIGFTRDKRVLRFLCLRMGCERGMFSDGR